MCKENAAPLVAIQGSMCFSITVDAASDCDRVAAQHICAPPTNALDCYTGQGGQDIDALQDVDSCCEGSSDNGPLPDCSTCQGDQDIDTLQQVDSCSEGSVETLLFFDWDDTLFPTSWLLQQRLCDVAGVGEAMVNDDQQALLQKMADGVSRMLQEALQIGTVVIVTNAEQGWVEMSCSKWMPSVAHLLQNVRIVSARSTYESKSWSPTEWKRLAFVCEAELFYGATTDRQPRNIISLGDSLHEQLALMAMSEGMPNCYRKSLKFLPSPTIGQLIEQHEFVSGCLLDVAEQSDDLDVEIEINHLY